MLELSVATRAANLARMAEGSVDVLVVGGGITGAGVALDAAARGLSVAVVEREDFASGTSGRSSRLIHGGLRYLRHGDVGLVYESLRERRILLRVAPHLVRPLGFLTPIHRPLNRAYFGVGLSLYGALAAGRNVGRHRWVDRSEVARLAPTLSRRSAGYLSFDCRTDDARLTMEILRASAAAGAAVANHAEVEGLLGQGRVTGAAVRDRVSGSTLDVRARVVVNATGVWAGRVRELAGPAPERLRPSKGIHAVLPRARLPIRVAVMVPSVAGDGAMVFAIPWGPRVYAGTTDTEYHGPLEEPVVEPGDLQVVLGSLARAFDGDLGLADVRASWAGVRPLLDTGRGSTRDLSRRHLIVEDPPGLLSVTGGKLTTYRAMAEQVVDRACRIVGKGRPCATRGLPLGLRRPLLTELGRAATEAERLGLPPDAGRRMVLRYGDDWEEAVGRIREDPALGQELVEGLPVLGVEVDMARVREMALFDDDVLERRTRLATMDREAAGALRLPPPPAGPSGSGRRR